MKPPKRSVSRRKFIKLTGTALALAGVPAAALSAGASQPPLSTFGGITPNRDFYLTSYGGTPVVDPRTWTLKVHGLVNRPVTLTYDDVKQMPSVRQMLTLECIGNPVNGSAIGNAEWTGFTLKPLLDRAGVKRGAVYAAMRAADGYYTGIPIDEIMREENWMPYLMNGVPLPAEHGFPLRIFIPGKYGMKQPKWITEIEFVDRPFTGYWDARGWSNEAWRKVNSGFFYPKPAGSVFDILSFSSAAKVSGPVDIVGWALAGPSGIRRVEVSEDEGRRWRDAQIVSNNSRYVWTVWKHHFAQRAPGEYSVRVRATDGNGRTQPERDPNEGDGVSTQPRLLLRVSA